MRQRIPTRGLQLMVLVALLGGVVAYSAVTKVVVLDIDGERVEVRTAAGTVSDVLEAEGVELRSADEVSVSEDASLSSGDEIVVRYAKPVTVTIDGEETERIVHDTSVEEVLERFDVEVTEDAYVSHDLDESLDREGIEITVSTPKMVTVIADGHERATTTVAPTVADLLNELAIVLGEDDELSAEPDAILSEDDVVKVVRIEYVERTEDVDVDFETEVRDDDDAYEGETEVVQAGEKGVAEEDVRLTLADGEVRDREVLDRRVTTEPTTKIEARGTKPRPAPETPELTGDTGVWDRLAQCESGGNWSINTGNGYYGGLQFNLRSWQGVGGTGYPHEHSREEQIRRGQILQQRYGWGQWPACSSKLGLR